jgi:hypothetical protein
MPAPSISLAEATPGGRVFGAPFRNHANRIKRAEPGAPGVTPFQIPDFRGNLRKCKRGMPAPSISLAEATPGGRVFGAPFWNHENVIERGKHGVPGITPSRFVILRDFL